jgi:hypothetical protein
VDKAFSPEVRERAARMVELGTETWENGAGLRGAGFKSGLPLFRSNLLIKYRNNLWLTACKAVYGGSIPPSASRFWIAALAVVNTNELRRGNNGRRRACRSYFLNLFFEI